MGTSKKACIKCGAKKGLRSFETVGFCQRDDTCRACRSAYGGTKECVNDGPSLGNDDVLMTTHFIRRCLERGTPKQWMHLIPTLLEMGRQHLGDKCKINIVMGGTHWSIAFKVYKKTIKNPLMNQDYRLALLTICDDKMTSVTPTHNLGEIHIP